jgi:hypothetical protein
MAKQRHFKAALKLAGTFAFFALERGEKRVPRLRSG